VEFLATLRNRVLEPIFEFDKYKYVLFLNDIQTTASAIQTLIETPVPDYDMICALDFSKSDFSMQSNLRVMKADNVGKKSGLRFYDIWVTRDLDGNIFENEFPWARKSRYICSKAWTTFSSLYLLERNDSV